MGLQATFYDMVACHLLMYSPMGWSPEASIAATTGGYYHSLPTQHFAVIPVIRLAAQWRNPPNTFRTPPITTHISLPYRSTNWATALYTIPRARTVALAFASTLTIIPRRLRAFRRFYYTAASRKVGSRSRSMQRPCHCHKPSSTLGWWSHTIAAIGKRCNRTCGRRGDGGEW